MAKARVSNSSNNSEEGKNKRIKQNKTGLWTKEEEHKFENNLKLFYQEKITRRAFYKCMQPMRSEKQVISHLNKNRYKYERNFWFLKQSKKMLFHYQQVLEEFAREKEKNKAPKNYVQFTDEFSLQSVLVNMDLISLLLRFSKPNKYVTVTLDENILKLALDIRYTEIMMKNKNYPEPITEEEQEGQRAIKRRLYDNSSDCLTEFLNNLPSTKMNTVHDKELNSLQSSQFQNENGFFMYPISKPDNLLDNVSQFDSSINEIHEMTQHPLINRPEFPNSSMQNDNMSTIFNYKIKSLLLNEDSY